ncbi:MAG: hypothetical protein OXM61_12040 [Candidatus Poribacteria bacterium]|nr:hypothetical protein [Candidatus Poribacteria bacterium]
MDIKLHWGIAALIIILIAAGGFMYWQWSSVQQLKEQLAQDDKLLEEKEEPVAKNNLPPAEPGKKWVPHGDHFHQVPIDAPDVWQEGTPEPVAKEVQAKPAYTGPLTYHTELLKTNPVEALRLQAEERGHWSAKWIPPFPPDDTEAAEIARTEYLIIYYETIGDTDNPEYKKANRAGWEQGRRTAKALREAYSARVADLMILTWPRFPELDVPPLYEKGWRTSPSDYFPLQIEDLKFPLSNPK